VRTAWDWHGKQLAPRARQGEVSVKSEERV
jgi:hypothetical protein